MRGSPLTSMGGEGDVHPNEYQCLCELELAGIEPATSNPNILPQAPGNHESADVPGKNP